MDYTVTIINTSGVHRAEVDNTGATDASAGINDIISKFVDDNGLDLFFNPGVYLLHNPIRIYRSNISIQGYCYGFRCSPRRLGIKGKTGEAIFPEIAAIRLQSPFDCGARSGERSIGMFGPATGYTGLLALKDPY